MDDRKTPSDTVGDMNPGDEALLEQLIDVNFDPSALQGVDDATRARAERLAALMGLLQEYPVETVTDDQRESLIAATMARINRSNAAQQNRMQLQPGGRLPRVRLREFVAIAAVLIVGLVIILPMIRSTSTLENTDLRTARLLDFSKALDAFAGDHDGELPSIQMDDPLYEQAIDHNPTMLDVSQCADGYGLDQDLITQAQQQFSFHSQQAPKIFRVNIQGGTVIISDRNLYLERVLDGQALPEESTHRPLVLKSDGSAGISPCLVSQDHIWDCDRQRRAGKPVIEIFLIHARTPADSGSTTSN
ncbi:MAG: hypothetical protein VX527_12590 [Planctomycetota bacterium]|nr:hypothetical protein [Planctomycetota bacterium]